MPTKVSVLNDERAHHIWQDQHRELCQLAPLPAGPYLVLAKGDLIAFRVSFAIRLDVFRLGHAVLATGETSFADPGSYGPYTPTGFGTFALTVAASVPPEGGAGSGLPPPPPRVSLSARWKSGLGSGAIYNITIAAIRVDELVETTIPPDPVIFDTATAALLRMRGLEMPAAPREDNRQDPLPTPPTSTKSK
jgi:hypothetical protein